MEPGPCITWGETYAVMPFANTLYSMDLTGAQIMELLNRSAILHKGILRHHPAGRNPHRRWNLRQAAGAKQNRLSRYRAYNSNPMERARTKVLALSA
jgi:2',3'-cyclic-nucleotide 2'-phosphodiesterase (5'-nucleotidase family)